MKIAIVAGGQTSEAQGTLGSAQQLRLAGSRLGHTIDTVELPPHEPAAQRLARLSHLLDYDVTIPLVSGLEGTLELLGVPYVGSSPDAAGIAANKVAFNAVAVGCGLRKVPYVALDTTMSVDVTGLDLRGPLYVKPARLGASFGISRVVDPADLASAIEFAGQHDTLVVIEQEVPRPFYEVEVAGVWSDDPVWAAQKVSAPGATWRDSDWKYSIDELVEDVPDDTVGRACIEVAQRLRAVVGLGGAFRFDLFVAGGAIYVGEVNAVPGHGVASTFPRILELAGHDRTEQFELLRESAVRQHRNASGQRVRA